MRIYQAGPLFSEAEIRWHQAFKAKLTEAGYDVLWPGEFFTQEEINAWGPEAPKRIMEQDSTAIDQSDAVVALLDGAQVDDGTAWEIGYAYAKGIPVIGIRTDFRRGGDTPASCVNAMFEGSCKSIVRDVEGVLDALKYLQNHRSG